jgi:CTP:molybdopterin cytidylyltransferase MocA
MFHTVHMQNSGTAAGVLLAAGAGTRYGMPKVRAENGRWLRACVAALNDGGCDDVVVVLGRRAQRVGACGHRGHRRAVRGVAPVDTPDAGADAIRRVLDAARSSPSGLARAHYDGRPGHPVVIAREHWPELLATLRGDEGARPFLGGRTDVIAVDCADLATGRDIDTR